jgi:hypothetical protein
LGGLGMVGSSGRQGGLRLGRFSLYACGRSFAVITLLFFNYFYSVRG